ncbi:ZIP family metal transporter [Novosphingobium huizhouense]|uniref:ZIP family metal transporter n=1 Tax=Novosphingobium huizhouense TaxID=2866625 RepID=UPI001CD87804|nr:ZIP family metal transporter [Novosphingobium huizhouense]
MTPLLAGALASLATGVATGFGAAPVLGMARPHVRRQEMLLGFAGGVMIAAAFFSLIAPGIALARTQSYGQVGAALAVAGAVAAGAGLLALLGRHLPAPEHVSAPGDCTPAGGRNSLPPPVRLLVLAITLHNIPEGAAVGMSFADGTEAGLATAIGIGTQNLPEGLAVSCALLAAGQGRMRAFAGGAASGLVEPVAGLGAALLVTQVAAVLPWGLGAAAGAMLLIVADHILPQVAGEGRRGHGLAAFFAGLVLMLVLDTAFA